MHELDGLLIDDTQVQQQYMDSTHSLKNINIDENYRIHISLIRIIAKSNTVTKQDGSIQYIHSILKLLLLRTETMVNNWFSVALTFSS